MVEGNGEEEGKGEGEGEGERKQQGGQHKRVLGERGRGREKSEKVVTKEISGRGRGREKNEFITKGVARMRARASTLSSQWRSRRQGLGGQHKRV